jgi:hypothetical protein
VTTTPLTLAALDASGNSRVLTFGTSRLPRRDRSAASSGACWPRGSSGVESRPHTTRTSWIVGYSGLQRGEALSIHDAPTVTGSDGADARLAPRALVAVTVHV